MLFRYCILSASWCSNDQNGSNWRDSYIFWW